LTQNVNKNFTFFAKRHCLLLLTQQWRVNDVDLAGTAPLKSWLYRYLNKRA